MMSSLAESGPSSFEGREACLELPSDPSETADAQTLPVESGPASQPNTPLLSPVVSPSARLRTPCACLVCLAVFLVGLPLLWVLVGRLVALYYLHRTEVSVISTDLNLPNSSLTATYTLGMDVPTSVWISPTREAHVLYSGVPFASALVKPALINSGNGTSSLTCSELHLTDLAQAEALGRAFLVGHAVEVAVSVTVSLAPASQPWRRISLPGVPVTISLLVARPVAGLSLTVEDVDLELLQGESYPMARADVRVCLPGLIPRLSLRGPVAMQVMVPRSGITIGHSRVDSVNLEPGQCTIVAGNASIGAGIPDNALDDVVSAYLAGNATNFTAVGSSMGANAAIDTLLSRLPVTVKLPGTDQPMVLAAYVGEINWRSAMSKLIHHQSIPVPSFFLLWNPVSAGATLLDANFTVMIKSHPTAMIRLTSPLALPGGRGPHLVGPFVAWVSRLAGESAVGEVER
eukprot:RCo037828